MRLDPFQTLRQWLEQHPSREATAALHDIELMHLDTARIQRFASRRRIPSSQRHFELKLVEQRLRDYRAVHARPSQRSAIRWISVALGLPANRVRGYLEQIVADEREGVRHDSNTLCEGESLTSDTVLGQSRADE